MKSRRVVFAPEARDDINALYDWIADAAGADTAFAYIERLESFCRELDLASARGTERHDIRAGLRILGFERNLTIAIAVDTEQVTILRLFYRGRNWQAEF